MASESSVCLQSRSLFSSSSSLETTTNRKSANASDLGVERLKQVRLHAYRVSMFVAKKICLNATRYCRWDCLEYSIKYGARFFFVCCIFDAKTAENLQRIREGQNTESWFLQESWSRCVKFCFW